MHLAAGLWENNKDMRLDKSVEIEIKTSFCNFEPISKDIVGQTRLNPIHIYFKDNGEGIPMNIKNDLNLNWQN